jgi:hypothetical protein
MPPRTAGFGNRDRFELNGKIGLHRAAGLIVVRECRQWQHSIASSFKSGFEQVHRASGLGELNLAKTNVSRVYYAWV